MTNTTKNTNTQWKDRVFYAFSNLTSKVKRFFSTLPEDKYKERKTFFTKLGKAAIFPVTVLAFAGIIFGITNGAMSAQGADYVDTFGWKVGKVVLITSKSIIAFSPLLISGSIALSMANKNKGVAVMGAMLSIVVTHVTISTLLSYKFIDEYGVSTDYMITKGASWSEALFINNSYQKIFGVTSYNIGIFFTILIGLFSTIIHNKFIDMKVPQILGFFKGTRLTPIISMFSSIIFGVFLWLLYPLLIGGVQALNKQMAGNLNSGRTFLGTFYQLVLWPFGLSNLFISDSMNSQVLLSEMAFGNGMAFDPAMGFIGLDAGTVDGAFSNIHRTPYTDLNVILGAYNSDNPMAGLIGDRQIRDLGAITTSAFTYSNFVIPAILASLLFTMPKNSRRSAMLPLVLASLSSFFGYSDAALLFMAMASPLVFMLLVPLLFAVWSMLFGAMDVSIVPKEYTTDDFGIIQSGVAYAHQNGLGDSATYYTFNIFATVPVFMMFTFILFRKRPIINFISDFDKEVYLENSSEAEVFVDQQGVASIENTKKVIEGLGGFENISSYTNCITKLRVEVKNSELVKEDSYFKDTTGAIGVVKMGVGIQVAFGPKAQDVRNTMEAIEKRGTK